MVVGRLVVCVLHLCQAVRQLHSHSFAGTVHLHFLHGMRAKAPVVVNARCWNVDLFVLHLVHVMIVRGGRGGMGACRCGPYWGGCGGGGVSHCGRVVGLVSS